MPIHVGDAGVFKEPTQTFVGDAGVWKEVQETFVGDAGVWKSAGSAQAGAKEWRILSQNLADNSGKSTIYYSGFNEGATSAPYGQIYQPDTVDGLVCTSANLAQRIGTIDYFTFPLIVEQNIVPGLTINDFDDFLFESFVVKREDTGEILMAYDYTTAIAGKVTLILQDQRTNPVTTWYKVNNTNAPWTSTAPTSPAGTWTASYRLYPTYLAANRGEMSVQVPLEDSTLYGQIPTNTNVSITQTVQSAIYNSGL